MIENYQKQGGRHMAELYQNYYKYQVSILGGGLV